MILGQLYIVLRAIQDIASIYSKLMCAMAQTITSNIKYVLSLHSNYFKVVNLDNLHENLCSDHGPPTSSNW